MNTPSTTGHYARNMVLLAGFTAGLADFLFASIQRSMSGGSWMDEAAGSVPAAYKISKQRRRV